MPLDMRVEGGASSLATLNEVADEADFVEHFEQTINVGPCNQIIEPAFVDRDLKHGLKEHVSDLAACEMILMPKELGLPIREQLDQPWVLVRVLGT